MAANRSVCRTVSGGSSRWRGGGAGGSGSWYPRDLRAPHHGGAFGGGAPRLGVRLGGCLLSPRRRLALLARLQASRAQAGLRQAVRVAGYQLRTLHQPAAASDSPNTTPTSTPTSTPIPTPIPTPTPTSTTTTPTPTPPTASTPHFAITSPCASTPPDASSDAASASSHTLLSSQTRPVVRFSFTAPT